MKNVRMGIASLMLALCLVFAGSNGAKAQTTDADVNALLRSISLVTVQGGVVNLTTGDITVPVTLTDVEIITVKDVLNNADIKVLQDFLNNSLNNNNVLNDALNNLLQNAEIIKNNQVVVGVALLGDVVQFIVAKAPKQ